MLERTPAPQVIPTAPIRPVVRREQEHRDEQREPQRRGPPAAPATPPDGAPHIDEYARPRARP